MVIFSCNDAQPGVRMLNREMLNIDIDRQITKIECYVSIAICGRWIKKRFPQCKNRFHHHSNHEDKPKSKKVLSFFGFRFEFSWKEFQSSKPLFFDSVLPFQLHPPTRGSFLENFLSQINNDTWTKKFSQTDMPVRSDWFFRCHHNVNELSHQRQFFSSRARKNLLPCMS